MERAVEPPTNVYQIGGIQQSQEIVPEQQQVS